MPVKTRTSAPIFEVLEILKQLQADIKDIKEIKTDIADIKESVDMVMNGMPAHIFVPTDPPSPKPSGWFWS